MPGDLRTLLPTWNRDTGGVPRVGRSGDADADLLGMLEMDASAREIRVRSVLGATASFNIASFLSADWEAWSVERARLARDAARAIGREDIASRLYGLSYARIASLFDRGFVVSKAAGAPEPLSETEPLDFNYIRWIRTASLDALEPEKLPYGVARPTAFSPYAPPRVSPAGRGCRLLRPRERDRLHRGLRREVEFVGMSVTQPTQPSGGPDDLKDPAAADRVGQAQPSVPNVTGTLPLLASCSRRRAIRPRSRSEPIARVSKPSRTCRRPSSSACSPRRSISARIGWMRGSCRCLPAPRRAPAVTSVGAYLGAYGRVEDLRPAAAGQRIPISPDRRGQLALAVPSSRMSRSSSRSRPAARPHASMTHAAAAAVLRNGFLSRRDVTGETGERYASTSARRACATRGGCSTPFEADRRSARARLQFERGLHEGHRPLELDRYIEPFRTLFPLEAASSFRQRPEAVEHRRRNVVDGLALHTAWHTAPCRGARGSAGARHGRPEGDRSRARAARRVARRPGRSVDGRIRLSARPRRHDGRGGMLDSLAKGVRPPDPEFAESPRGGSTVRHRVLLVLGGDPMPTPDWDASMRRHGRAPSPSSTVGSGVSSAIRRGSVSRHLHGRRNAPSRTRAT